MQRVPEVGDNDLGGVGPTIWRQQRPQAPSKTLCIDGAG